tara:strand:+ start:1498 stop:1785 length:288 start_codon:yes stop_codon:yes gene_type:complete
MEVNIIDDGCHILADPIASDAPSRVEGFHRRHWVVMASATGGQDTACKDGRLYRLPTSEDCADEHAQLLSVVLGEDLDKASTQIFMQWYRLLWEP